MEGLNLPADDLHVWSGIRMGLSRLKPGRTCGRLGRRSVKGQEGSIYNYMVEARV